MYFMYMHKVPSMHFHIFISYIYGLFIKNASVECSSCRVERIMLILIHQVLLRVTNCNLIRGKHVEKKNSK